MRIYGFNYLIEMKNNKQKSIVPVENRSLQPKAGSEKTTGQEARKLAKEMLTAKYDPRPLFEKLAGHIDVLKTRNGKKAIKAGEEILKISDEIILALGLENHYPISQAVNEGYRGLIIDTARRLETEYECKTASEKILAEVVAGAYGRVIEYSKAFNSSTRAQTLSKEKNGYYNLFSMELDRAHRHLFMALTMLKQIKAPNIEMNIKTNNAFIAGQQVNYPSKSSEQ